MTSRAYVRTPYVDGKPTDKREIVVDGYLVATLTKFELMDLIAQGVISLKEDHGKV